MNRLEKELRKRGIIFETDEIDIFYHQAIDCCTKFVGIFNNIIVLAHYSEVLDPMFLFYDLNFNEIGHQDMIKDNMHFEGSKMNPWSAYTNEPSFDGEIKYAWECEE